MLIYPYKKGSASVKALKDSLGIKSIKTEGSRLVGSAAKKVINWGSSDLPANVAQCTIINAAAAVAIAANKLRSFQAMNDLVSIPEFTTDRAVADQWLDAGKVVVCRTKLSGHSGEGIVIAETRDQMVAAPLYVQYIKKQQEFRVHIFNGEVLDVQRKARKNDVPNDMVNWKVRNLAGGFIYAREGFVTPDTVIEEAKAAVRAMGLDFGAVDVIYNELSSMAYVLEINTAPGLTGTTLEKYTAAFREVM